MFQTKKHILILLVFTALLHGLYAQTRTEKTETPYLALDLGGTAGEVMVDGFAGGIVIYPSLRLTPAISIGSKFGASYSSDGIISVEAQGYFRWNFLRFPFNNTDKNTTDIFIQGGIGVIGAVKGKDDDWDGSYDRTNTRSSLLGDVTFGISIPLSSRWHIEPSVRGGYPFKYGFALTLGHRFPLSQKTAVQPEILYRTEYVDIVKRDTVTVTETVYEPVIEYVPVIQTITREIIRRMMITQVEYILFAGDTSIFNQGIDNDAIALNDLVIDQIAHLLNDNPDCQVRIEGHANPVSGAPEEVQVLAALSANRAHEVARLLRAKGVKNEQINVIAYGGTRTISRERAHWNMNRRVELIVFQGEIL